MDYGNRIRQVRKKKGKTLTFVAGKLGRTPGWLSNIEHGRRKVTLEDALKIAEVIGVPAKEFFKSPNLNETFNGQSLVTGTG